MKTLKQIFDIIEEAEISIDDYFEEGKLCGYELNSYTQAGVNEILFLDFRKEHQNPTNVNDFIKEFKDYVNAQTIDERIDNNRQSEAYKRDFTLKESLTDFTNFDKKLRELLKEISNQPETKKEFKQLKKKHEKIRNILIDYGNKEFGDCIIDEICEAVGVQPTTIYYNED